MRGVPRLRPFRLHLPRRGEAMTSCRLSVPQFAICNDHARVVPEFAMFNLSYHDLLLHLFDDSALTGTIFSTAICRARSLIII